MLSAIDTAPPASGRYKPRDATEDDLLPDARSSIVIFPSASTTSSTRVKPSGVFV